MTTPTILQAWAAVAALTFLVLVVLAGLHFKDPKQRGILLFVACLVAAASWPLLLPYWAISLVWSGLGAVSLRRAKAATGLVEAHSSHSDPSERPPPPDAANAKPGTRFYGPGGSVKTKE